MKLTRIQHKFLNALLLQRETQSALFKRLLRRSLHWLLLGFICFVASFCFRQLELQLLADIFIGIWLGGLLADGGWVVTGHRLRPIINEITDWDKVKKLIRDFANASSSK